MKGSVKKDKKTGKHLYIVDNGIELLTGKRKQKRSRKCFNKVAFRSSYWNICAT